MQITFDQDAVFSSNPINLRAPVCQNYHKADTATSKSFAMNIGKDCDMHGCVRFNPCG